MSWPSNPRYAITSDAGPDNIYAHEGWQGYAHWLGTTATAAHAAHTCAEVDAASLEGTTCCASCRTSEVTIETSAAFYGGGGKASLCFKCARRWRKNGASCLSCGFVPYGGERTGNSASCTKPACGGIMHYTTQRYTTPLGSDRRVESAPHVHTPHSPRAESPTTAGQACTSCASTDAKGRWFWGKYGPCFTGQPRFRLCSPCGQRWNRYGISCNSCNYVMYSRDIKKAGVVWFAGLPTNLGAVQCTRCSGALSSKATPIDNPPNAVHTNRVGAPGDAGATAESSEHSYGLPDTAKCNGSTVSTINTRAPALAPPSIDCPSDSEKQCPEANNSTDKSEHDIEKYGTTYMSGANPNPHSDAPPVVSVLSKQIAAWASARVLAEHRQRSSALSTPDTRRDDILYETSGNDPSYGSVERNVEPELRSVECPDARHEASAPTHASTRQSPTLLPAPTRIRTGTVALSSTGGKGMGTGWRKQAFLPFKKAHAYACSLKMNGLKEWTEWSKRGARPANIPSNPAKIYKHDGWQGWGHWLNSSNLHTRAHLPFNEALLYARSLKLKTQKEWMAWSKSGSRPLNLPSAPDRAYKHKGWQGLQHWLGTKKTPGTTNTGTGTGTGKTLSSETGTSTGTGTGTGAGLHQDDPIGNTVVGEGMFTEQAPVCSPKRKVKQVAQEAAQPYPHQVSRAQRQRRAVKVPERLRDNAMVHHIWVAALRCSLSH